MATRVIVLVGAGGLRSGVVLNLLVACSWVRKEVRFMWFRWLGDLVVSL